MTDVGLALGKSGTTHGQRETAKLPGFQDAINAVEAETLRSGLPGPETGGPGNAYKHLLITAELYRRFGPTVGPALAWARELSNRLGRQSA